MMKKEIAILVVIMMLGVMFIGCASKQGGAETDSHTAEIAGNADESADSPAADSVMDNAAGAGTASESYTAYTDAKAIVVTRLSEGLASNEDTVWSSLSLMGVVTADLALLPATFFGLGQESAAAGLAFLGNSDVTYSENGNHYTMTYSDKEGVPYVFSGTYDAGADALVCTGSANSEENIYSEYRKTPFGYVAQYYFVNEDGTVSLYQLSLSGEDGAIGILTAGGKPPALTGSESVDFPTGCPEWYAISGSTITGVMSDGTQVNFEYVPTPTQ